MRISFPQLMSDAPVTPAQLALEKSGLEFLRNGKFRKARDVFKSLHKLVPSRALPLLIEANLGLANDMMSKGQVSEANQVIAYLRTIAPPSFKLTPISEDGSRDAWAAMVPLAALRLATTPGAVAGAGIRAADEMILGASSPDHPDHPDAKAILSALEIGYGSATSEQTAKLLRSVPRASPFSHWVFFFKGMTAMEAGAHARAADYFRRVPENSLLHSAMPALLTLAGAPPTALPASNTVHALCTWIGHPTLAGPLILAEPLWRKKQQSKAFTLLTKQVPGLFSLAARSFHADLTRFLTSEFVQTYVHYTNYHTTVLDYILVRSRTVACAAVDQAFFAIDFADYQGCAHAHFTDALDKIKTISAVTPVSPAMLSRIFTELAAAYIHAVKKNARNQCCGPNAKKALEHAIKHDPDHLGAWLMQCDLLSMGKDRSAYHRFLDDLSKRFPTQKEVLIRNGDCCTARKTYTKALRNFESAAQIDSVDPRISRGLLCAHLGLAEDAYKKGKEAKVNWDLIDSLASTNKSCSEHALWRLRVRRIVLEARFGKNEAKVAALVAATLPHAPNAFRLETACRFAIERFNFDFKDKTLACIFPSRPGPESLADFLAVIEEVDAFANVTHHLAANSIARQVFARYEKKLLQCVVERKDLTTLLIAILKTSSPDLALASAVIKKWCLHDPSDALMRYLCAMYQFPWLHTPHLTKMSNLVNQLRDSPDPDIQRLLILFERDRQRATAARYGKPHRERSLKLDLDYDPHQHNDDDCDDYDNYDDDFDADDCAAADAALAKMSPAQLMGMFEKIFSDTGLPDLEPDLFSDPFSGRKPPKKPR